MTDETTQKNETTIEIVRRWHELMDQHEAASARQDMERVQDLLAQLESASIDVANKADGYAYVADICTAKGKLLREFAKATAGRAKQWETEAENVRARLAYLIHNTTRQPKTKAVGHTITYRPPKMALHIEPGSTPPMAYAVRVDDKWDKKKATAAFAEDPEILIKGACMREGKPTVAIRGGNKEGGGE